MSRARFWGAWVLVCVGVGSVALASCAREINDGDDDLPADGSVQGGGSALTDGGGPELDPFGNPIGPAPTYDASVDLVPVSAGSDAFFINDPPPPYCGPEDEDPGEPITGSVDCPSDKNRQGCPCTDEGEVADCWPGKRIHRDHGICKDGTTTCTATEEFGLLWGPCDGYVLPKEGALVGPDACRCFSAGVWKLSNLSPCIYQGAEGVYLYSSTLDAEGGIECGSNVPDPPPEPEEDWGTSTLNVDCAGQFKLCYTIKAGDVDNPRATDCKVMEYCVDVWYPEANQDFELPNVPGWVSEDTDCAGQFERSGGYGEMNVIGESIECDVVDDGMGNPYVFHRTDYCPPSCQATPNTPECMGCQTGGSGMFN